MPPSRRARERAKTFAWNEVRPDHGDTAAERAEETLRSDDLWCWLAAAADRAEDMGTYRALARDPDEREYDDVLGHIEKSEAHLIAARDRRREELLQPVLAGESP